MNRRGFLKSLGLVAGMAVTVPATIISDEPIKPEGHSKDYEPIVSYRVPEEFEIWFNRKNILGRRVSRCESLISMNTIDPILRGVIHSYGNPVKYFSVVYDRERVENELAHRQAFFDEVARTIVDATPIIIKRG
ncbi:MAG: hypothetical protein ACYTE8_00980 [Planctomycetota bacterium]|jgi:hypothetical protein